jgi:hypothetical protein
MSENTAVVKFAGSKAISERIAGRTLKSTSIAFILSKFTCVTMEFTDGDVVQLVSDGNKAVLLLCEDEEFFFLLETGEITSL